MKLPAHLLLALTLAAPLVALADGASPTLGEAPALEMQIGESLIPELTEPVTEVDVLPTSLTEQAQTALAEVLELIEPEHDPDWCPPCGRG